MEISLWNKKKSQIISCTLYFSFKAIKNISKPVSTRDDLNFSIFITYHIFFSWIFLHSNKIFPSISDFLFSKSCTSLVVPISRFYWGLKNESNSHTKAIFKGLKENRQKSIVELHLQYSICMNRRPNIPLLS